MNMRVTKLATDPETGKTVATVEFPTFAFLSRVLSDMSETLGRGLSVLLNRENFGEHTTGSTLANGFTPLRGSIGTVDYQAEAYDPVLDDEEGITADLHIRVWDCAERFPFACVIDNADEIEHSSGIDLGMGAGFETFRERIGCRYGIGHHDYGIGYEAAYLDTAAKLYGTGSELWGYLVQVFADAFPCADPADWTTAFDRAGGQLVSTVTLKLPYGYLAVSD